MNKLLVNVLRKYLVLNRISFRCRSLHFGPEHYPEAEDENEENFELESPTSNSTLPQDWIHIRANNIRETRIHLQMALKIEDAEALNLVTKNRKLLYTPASLISKNIKICLKYDLKHRILGLPFLLYEANLEEKISRLIELPLVLSTTIPFVRYNIKKLHQMALNKDETVSEIKNLCEIFEMSIQDMCLILSGKPFLFSKSTEELKRLLAVFQEYNISKEDIIKDFWIFSYKEKTIRNRFDFIRHNGISNIKTWMVRCQESALYRHIKRETDNRDILGENSVSQYLSQKLCCSENVAKSIIRKHPQLLTKSLLKMNLMIDLLYKYGYTPLQICKTPKILLHSTNTVEKRLKYLASIGKKSDYLYIIIKSQKQYLQHLENFTKQKTNSGGNT